MHSINVCSHWLPEHDKVSMIISVSLFLRTMGILAIFLSASLSAAQDKPAPLSPPLSDLTQTVVFDNTSYNNVCGTSWGFACVVECPELIILFDTGTDGDLLIANMQMLDIDPASIDVVVLSHEHWDHIDGLSAFISANNGITVVMPQSFSGSLKTLVTGAGAE